MHFSSGGMINVEANNPQESTADVEETMNNSSQEPVGLFLV